MSLCRYTEYMAQLVTQVDDKLVVQLDEMVEGGEVESRSDAVRRALETMIADRRRRLVAEATVEAYRRVPQTAEELREADAAARDMIADEPW